MATYRERPDEQPEFSYVPQQAPSFLGGFISNIFTVGALAGIWYGVAAATGRNVLGGVLSRALRPFTGKAVAGTALGESIRQAEAALAELPIPTIKRSLEGLLPKAFSKIRPSRWGVGYEPLTVGRALELGVLAPEEAQLFESALRRGWVTPASVVDPHLFLAGAQIRDLRLLSSYGWEAVSQKSSFLGIPRLIRDIMPVSLPFARLGYRFRKAAATRHYYVGGDIYAAYESELRKVATGHTLAVRGGPMQPTRAIMYGEAWIKEPQFERGPLGLLDRILAPVGIGRRYATRPTLWERWILDPIRRAKALKSGEATIIAKPYRYVGELQFAHAMLGGELPELFPGGARPIEKTMAKAPEELTFWERLKTIFGLSTTHVVIKSEARAKLSLGQPITAEDLFIPPKRGAVLSIESPVAAEVIHSPLKSPLRGQLTAGGFVSPYVYPEYYAKPSGFWRGVKELANYMAIRLNALAGESILGIGFKPSSLWIANVARVAAIPFAYEALRQGILATDYTIEQLTGVSPIKGLAWVYSRLRLGQQWLRDLLGINTAANWLEYNFPGIISSGASFLVRVFALPAFTLFKVLDRKGSLAKSALAAAMVLGVLGPGLGQSYQELWEEYAGIRQVPRRAGRFWAMGYRPFFGGKITHFEPSWYVKLMNDAWYRSVYGSKEAYFAHQNVFGVPFPTPWNLFGLRNITEPYWYEERMYYERPTPYTGALFEEFPIFGPLLSATVGAVLKPVKRMHEEEGSFSVVRSGLPEESKKPAFIAERLGLEPFPRTVSTPLAPTEFSVRARIFGRAALAPLGVYDFILARLGVYAHIQPKYPQPFMLQSALDNTSLARELQAAGLGGFVGQCFVEGTKVLTKRGFVPIEKVLVGDEVLSLGGKWREVKSWHMLGEASDLYRVEIPALGQELIVTAKHHIPVIKGSDAPRDIEVYRIEPGDKVIVPIPEPEPEPEPIPGWAADVDEHFGRVAALWLVASKHYVDDTIVFDLPALNLGILTDTARSIEKLFGKPVTLTFVQEGASLNVKSAALQSFIEDVFESEQYRAYLVRATDEAAQAFLTALIGLSAIGSPNKFRLALDDDQDALLVFLLAARFGAAPRIKAGEFGYLLSWGADAAHVLATLFLGPQPSDKRTVFVEVGAVEPLAITVPVYDLTIEDYHYYTANGVMVHNTEFLRRFLFTPRYRPSALRKRINPIRNTMPTWLPGSASEYRQDRTYYVDFHTGVAQLKIAGGEYILPGPGYEATHPFHSGTPGVYDPVDKLLVLAQAAPFSKAFQDVYHQVRMMWGELTPQWRHIISVALEQREARRGWRQAGNWDLWRVEQESAQKETLLAPLQQMWVDLVKLGQDIPWVGAKFAPDLTPEERYKREVLYGATIPDWAHPIRHIAMPWMYTTVNSPPLRAAFRGLLTGYLISSPIAAMFMPVRPAIAGFPWALGAGSAAAAGVRAALTGGDIWIPPDVLEQRRADEYLDYLHYVRSRVLQNVAEAGGENTIAKYYAKQAVRTLVGAATVRDYRLALSPYERPYFDAFRYAPPHKRPEISKLVPDHMRQVLEKVWSDEDRRRRHNIQLHEGFKHADEAAASYFKVHPLPPPDSLVWHPDVDFGAIRVKFVQGGIGGLADELHAYGYYPSQIEEVRQRYPQLDVEVPLINGPVLPAYAQMFYWALHGGYRGVDYNKLVDFQGMSQHIPRFSRITIERSNRDEWVTYVHDIAR